MGKGHWFWNSVLMNVVEKQLLNLTHWVWMKRHDSVDEVAVPVAANTEPAAQVEEQTKPAAKRPARKKSPKGNEWSVK